MKKLSKKTIAFLAAAVILFAGSGVMGTRAVLNIYSPDYTLEFATDDQDVALIENGTQVSGNNSLIQFLGGKFTPGKAYTEQLSALNTSESDQYVRVIVRKYWIQPGSDATEKSFADRKLDPAMIGLEFAGGNWVENKSEATDERNVYYYTQLVPSGGETSIFTKTLTVDGKVVDDVTYSDADNGVVTYTYKYDGYQIVIEAEAQSIQTHNANDAVKSIWGVQNVSVSGTTLSVN